jgi:hypothetical protein
MYRRHLEGIREGSPFPSRTRQDKSKESKRLTIVYSKGTTVPLFDFDSDDYEEEKKEEVMTVSPSDEEEVTTVSSSTAVVIPSRNAAAAAPPRSSQRRRGKQRLCVPKLSTASRNSTYQGVFRLDQPKQKDSNHGLSRLDQDGLIATRKCRICQSPIVLSPLNKNPRVQGFNRFCSLVRELAKEKKSSMIPFFFVLSITTA